MSDTRNHRSGVVRRATQLVHSLVGAADERTERPDEGVEVSNTAPAGAHGVDATEAAGAGVAESGGYREHVARLTAEDREKEADILELVGRRGGMVRQKKLVEATGYSEATVSRHLQMLERTDLVVRLTRGREKIVCLPDIVPDELRG